MKDSRILESICKIQQVCSEIEYVLKTIQKQGRMASLVEAQKVDEMAIDLMERIKTLPDSPCSLMESDTMREMAAESLKNAAIMIKRVLFSAPRKRENRPSGSSARLRAYAAY